MFRTPRPIAALALLAAGYGLACTNNSPDVTAPSRVPAALLPNVGSGGQGTHGYPLTAVPASAFDRLPPCRGQRPTAKDA
jgi:hypothetical protein